MLRPLIASMNGESLGQLPEVFDGDESVQDPRRPGGCIAQAWSVAETLRVLLMALTPAAGTPRDSIESKPAARTELRR